jgi:hypothetical protein
MQFQAGNAKGGQSNVFIKWLWSSIGVLSITTKRNKAWSL